MALVVGEGLAEIVRLTQTGDVKLLAGGLAKGAQREAPVLEETASNDLPLREVRLGDVFELLRGRAGATSLRRSRALLLSRSRGGR